VAGTFATVVIAVFVAAALVCLVIFLLLPDAHADIGRGGLSLDTPDRPPPPAPGSAAARAEADDEIRQLVVAKSARREARGLPALDVEAEIEALKRRPPSRPADPALRAEVRDLVEARNERRVRHGREPLDVEVEVERQLRELGA
jgi:hypothetical protein